MQWHSAQNHQSAVKRYRVEILNGCCADDVVFVPRICLIPNNFHFSFKRVQFTVSVSIAMLPPLIKFRVRRYLLLDFTKVIVFHIATVCEIFADKYLQRTFLHAPVVGSTHNIVIEKQLPKNKNAEIYAVQC